MWYVGQINIHCRLVRTHDPWSQSESDETPGLLLEIHCTPFRSTVNAAFGLLKGKGVRGIRIQESYQEGRCVIRR